MIWRYRFVLFLFIGAFFLVIARLFYWQVVRAEELTTLGLAQYKTHIKILPTRGDIKTSDGFAVATSKLTYLLFANPKEISPKNKPQVISTLHLLLEIEKATLSAMLSQDLFWVRIKHGIDDSLKKKVEQYSLPGVGLQQESARFYPEASLSAHLIGFVGKNDIGENKGYFGLEGYYDRQLSGKEGIANMTNDALGRPIVAKVNTKVDKIDGRTLFVSVDRAIQFMVEKKLKKAVERYNASGGMVGIIEPKTGRILSMASYPSFDPRSYEQFNPTLYKNPFISSTYEPGSTFKALVMAAGIDAEVVKPDTKCPICEGPISIGGYEIKTWNNKYLKNITATETIQYSDNTGMVYVGRQLGLDKMLTYFDKFGIGKQTGVDLQGEVSTEVKPRSQWYPIDQATASFGQGISVTPIGLLSAFSALANEGKRMEPQVVEKIETPDGQIISIPPKMLSQPISSKTAKIMKEILVNAVEKGDAKWAKPKGYRIAGKTGTAQIPIAGHYDPEKTIASFIGFAPADNPKFAMLVIIDKPTTSIYGSETAAPLFFEIARDLFTYYGITPTE